MFRRFAAASVFGSAAVLGYVGARRLGEWIDAPPRAVPQHPVATVDGISDKIGVRTPLPRPKHLAAS
ncbi:hypothetical protein [Parasphingorhabdus pacifica]